MERALDVERKRVVEERVVDVEELRSAQRRTRRIELTLRFARVVDPPPYHLVDIFPRGDVGSQRERFAPLGDYSFGGLLRAVGVDVRAHDVCALAGKDHHRGTANAARPAGDDDRLSNEIVRGLGHGVRPRACKDLSLLEYAALAPGIEIIGAVGLPKALALHRS